MCWARGSIC
jgi:hypothetical protein